MNSTLGRQQGPSGIYQEPLKETFGETILLMQKLKNKDSIHWSHLELLSHKHRQKECLNSAQPDHLGEKITLCVESCVPTLNAFVGSNTCYVFRTLPSLYQKT